MLDVFRVRDAEGRDRPERPPRDPQTLAPSVGRLLRRLLPVVVREGIPGINDAKLFLS